MLVDGSDVTGVPVRERNVAMVYQQFINYPSMTVADNIASPLKLRGEKNVAAARARAGRQAAHRAVPATACRPSSRAASSSAWRWRARWPRARR